jgi:glyoxylase-like metal-dependent hydrolase (beta-lactamase superfamily II)
MIKWSESYFKSEEWFIMHPHLPPVDLGYDIHLIDLYDLNLPGRTGCYVIPDKAVTLIETGPGPSAPYLLEGLKRLNISTSDVQYIIVTHIHLDHAGGAGMLMRECPNAKLVVHPKGARHMADPSRLIAGAKAVYGENFEALFNPVLPVPEDRIMIKTEGDTLNIGKRTLTFYDTPGHANHHFSIYDPLSKGIFCGDTVGIHYHLLADQGFIMYLPSTSPNQFDPDVMLASIARFRKMDLGRIYFGHFGASEEVEDAFRQVEYWIPRFVKEGEKSLAESSNPGNIAKRLYDRIQRFLSEQNVPDTHPVYEQLKMDFSVCAMGIADYLNKKMKRATNL